MPSPQFHDQLTMEPSGSLDPRPSTSAVRKLVFDENDAVGLTLAGGGSVTVTGQVTEAVAPASSVTVSVTP